MTMAFLADTFKRTIDTSSSATAAQLIPTQTIDNDDDDLNLEKTLRAVATTTVKFLLRRNTNTTSITNTTNKNATNNITTTTTNIYVVDDDDDSNDNDYIDNDVIPKAENVQNTMTTTTSSAAATSPAAATDLNNVNNLSATITSIRSNVNRVLYKYFQNKNLHNEADDNNDDDDHDDFNVVNDNNPKSYDAVYAAQQQQQQQQHDTITKLSLYTTNEMPLAIATSTTTATGAVATAASSTALSSSSASASSLSRVAATITSEILQNSTYYQNITTTATTTSPYDNFSQNLTNSNNVILTTMTHLNGISNATTTTTTPAATATTIAPSITYPSIAISSYENCSALFANYTQPQQQGLFCNWTWDKYLCWPPTPAGVLARMNCPSGHHGVDAKNFANRKCELTGHWGSKPNETFNPIGWTDYNPCFKPEVRILMDKVSNLELVLEIAKRTRTLEIVGLILSLVALIISLIIFCNFRSLRNNRTKIHKNLFIAMVLQVVIRLTLYLDQAYRRDSQETTTNNSLSGIENTPFLCEASYVLLEYAKTAMFMWMFIEGWYLHNMVTVTVFQGRFPYKLFSIVGWGVPVLMTTIWATCTAIYYAASTHDCWWNYNLTPYYWILEGPRIIVITINFAFLLNIIRVLVMKLRESQASDIEQTRKAVRAAIVLLPLLGTINVLYLIPAYETPWKFALWSYGTHFLTTFQGFFIALLYCFLNGEVRAVLLKSLAVFMSVRGHPEWVPKRASMYSQAYNTAPDTENHPPDNKRNDSPATKRLNGRKASCTTVMIHHNTNKNNPKVQITPRLSQSNASGQPNHHNHHHNHRLGSISLNNNNGGGSLTNLNNIDRTHHQHHPQRHHNWMLTLCFRGQKVLRVPPASSEPPESVVFELSEQ